MNSKCDEKSMISLKNKIEEINESVGTLDWNENAFNILGEGQLLHDIVNNIRFLIIIPIICLYYWHH